MQSQQAQNCDRKEDGERPARVIRSQGVTSTSHIRGRVTIGSFWIRWAVTITLPGFRRARELRLRLALGVPVIPECCICGTQRFSSSLCSV
jgi:hypothetical protein